MSWTIRTHASSLISFIQLIHKQNEYLSILLQEFVESEYDVRAIVCNGEVVGAMKRPVVEGDFRSNVSLGAEAEMIEITDLEKRDTLKTAELVKGKLVGVDFIPAKDREKETPYFIEVNSTPGLIGIEKVGFSVTERVLEKLKSLKL